MNYFLKSQEKPNFRWNGRAKAALSFFGITMRARRSPRRSVARGDTVSGDVLRAHDSGVSPESNS